MDPGRGRRAEFACRVAVPTGRSEKVVDFVRINVAAARRQPRHRKPVDGSLSKTFHSSTINGGVSYLLYPERMPRRFLAATVSSSG